ncbi:ATP-dependent DNA helicase [Caligus rogercresseyi]|uniref:ATP-dependent DNA helicase n=1 Tax=Caligus rogercresseyi TaxID=217165 RepID=A0A7T8QV53_CALRO|nr:ATP-dependent DNA helicase [Caligus rogercresseyi]
MLLRNLSLRQGLCNGTRLKVTHMHNNCIQASILTGANQGNKVLILRIKLAPSDTNLPFILERHQFPLRLAYSIQ